MAARWAHNPKAVGSNPTPATNFRRITMKVQFYAHCNVAGFEETDIMEFDEPLSEKELNQICDDFVYEVIQPYGYYEILED